MVAHEGRRANAQGHGQLMRFVLYSFAVRGTALFQRRHIILDIVYRESDDARIIFTAYSGLPRMLFSLGICAL